MRGETLDSREELIVAEGFEGLIADLLEDEEPGEFLDRVVTDGPLRDVLPSVASDRNYAVREIVSKDTRAFVLADKLIRGSAQLIVCQANPKDDQKLLFTTIYSIENGKLARTVHAPYERDGMELTMYSKRELFPEQGDTYMHALEFVFDYPEAADSLLSLLGRPKKDELRSFRETSGELDANPLLVFSGHEVAEASRTRGICEGYNLTDNISEVNNF